MLLHLDGDISDMETDESSDEENEVLNFQHQCEEDIIEFETPPNVEFEVNPINEVEDDEDDIPLAIMYPSGMQNRSITLRWGSKDLDLVNSQCNVEFSRPRKLSEPIDYF